MTAGLLPPFTCITCKGKSFFLIDDVQYLTGKESSQQIKPNALNQTWLMCMACGERQPSDTKGFT